MPSITRNGYSAGKFLIELEGALVGIASAVEGGDLVGQVILEAADSTGLVKKHIGGINIEALTLTIGVDMGKELALWIAGFTARTAGAKDGAVVFVDYDGTVRSRLEWTHGRITEVRFPGGDATDQSAAEITVTIVPERVTTKAGHSTQASNVPSAPKTWTRNAFRVHVDSIANDTTFATRVEELVVRRPISSTSSGNQPGVIAAYGRQEVPDVVMTIPEGHTTEFALWLDDFLLKGFNADRDERNGTLQYLGPSMDVLATLSFKHLGITQLAWERAESGNSVAARVKVHLYCEEVVFDSPSMTQTPPTPPSTTDPTAETLLWATRKLLAERDGRVFAAEVASQGKVQNIAARLVATADHQGPATPTEQSDGFALGQRWAAERATLDEFVGLALLQDPEWTAIHVPKDHSLIAHLRDAGALPDGETGPLDLHRGPLVEGIIQGVADVADRIDSAAEMGDAASLRLQMAMDRLSKFETTMSNVVKKVDDTSASMIENFK